MFKKTATSSNFTTSAQAALALARQEAQNLHHTYIGTEHILLGLVLEDSGAVAGVLGTFKVNASKIGLEIEKLIQRGPENALSGDLPLTPRAKRAMDIAADEARNLCQNSIGPEHLLLGLILEGSGVAAQVLQNLGLKLTDVGREAFKTRIMQMKIVESAVRPVRATTAGKRKMREELLAHFTTIYDEEQARLNDSAAALKQAQQRFGDSTELSQELNRALPTTERIGYYIERWLGWRAPESAARYLMRVSFISFIIMSVIGALALVLDGMMGHTIDDWAILRPFAYTVLSVPVGQFVLGMLYFKLRDTLLGALGQQKSVSKSVLIVVLIALLTFVGSLLFTAVVLWDSTRVFHLLIPCSIAGIVVGIGYLLSALFRGPTEIRDTVWALLDLKQISTE